MMVTKHSDGPPEKQRSSKLVPEPKQKINKQKIQKSVRGSVLTDRQSFSSARLQEVGEDGQTGQQSARYDDSDHVIQRIAMNRQSERGSRERLAASVRHQSFRHVYICCNNKKVKKVAVRECWIRYISIVVFM